MPFHTQADDPFGRRTLGYRGTLAVRRLEVFDRPDQAIPPPKPPPSPDPLQFARLQQNTDALVTGAEPPLPTRSPSGGYRPLTRVQELLNAGTDVTAVQREAYRTTETAPNASGLRALAGVPAAGDAFPHALTIGPKPLTFIRPNVSVADMTPEERAVLARDAERLFLEDPRVIEEYRRQAAAGIPQGSPGGIAGTPDMTSLEAAATLANEPFRIAGELIAPGVERVTNPVIDRLPERIGPAPVAGPAQAVRDFAVMAAPYAVPGTQVPGMAGLLLQVAALTDDYKSGKLAGDDYLKQMGMIAGPILAIGAAPQIARAASEIKLRAAARLQAPEIEAFKTRLASERGSLEIPGDQPEQSRFTPEGDIVSEPVLPGDAGQQGDLLGAPAQTGEGLTIESAGALFSRVAPEVDAGSIGAAQPFERVPTSAINEDPANFQARNTDEGKSFSETRVNDIVKNYDPDLMSPLTVAPDPARPGEYTLLGGHNRLEALRRLGQDAPVQVVNIDLTDPVQLQRARQLADQTNFIQKGNTLRERIRAIERTGSADVGQIRSLLPALNDQQIMDAQRIGTLPGHVIDRLDKMPESSPLIGIASEIGLGVKDYGFLPADAEGLFNRLTAGTKNKLPTRASVRESVDLLGRIYRQRQQADMFSAEDAFGATNPLLDAIDQYARITRQVGAETRQLAKDIAGTRRLGVSEKAPAIVAAKKRLAELQARQRQVEAEVVASLSTGQERPSASASSMAEAGANEPISSAEGAPSPADVQAPRETVSTNAAPPSGLTTLNNEPSGPREGLTSTEYIGTSVPPETTPADIQAAGTGGNYGAERIEPGVRTEPGPRQESAGAQTGPFEAGFQGTPSEGPEGRSAGQPASGGVAGPKRIDTTLFRDEQGNQIQIDPIGMPRTLYGKGDVVQGVTTERWVPRPLRGDDVVGTGLESLQRRQERASVYMDRRAVEERNRAHQADLRDLDRMTVVEGLTPEKGGVRPKGRDIVGDMLTRESEKRITSFEARAKELGADPVVARIVSKSYRIGEYFAQTAKRYEDSSPVMQKLARLDAWIEGKVPDGVVNEFARAHLVAGNALRQYADEWLLNNAKGVDTLFAGAQKSAKFIGPADQRANVYANRGTFASAVINHRDWFKDLPAGLTSFIDQRLTPFQSKFYANVLAIDPNAAPAVDGPYIRSVWDLPESELSSAVEQFQGRASVTKKRAFPDPFEAMADPDWPYKLEDVAPSELISSSLHLSARQMGLQIEKKLITNRFGSTVRREGMIAFRNPNYAGYYGPPEVVNFVDQLHQPLTAGPAALGKNILTPLKNLIFGPGDIAVFGQNVLKLIATRGTATAAGAVNRALEAMHLPYFTTYMEADLPRAIQRTVDGLPQGVMGAVLEPKGGTAIKWFGPVGRAIDRPVSQFAEVLQNAQYQGILTPLRNMTYEGNLMMNAVIYKATRLERFNPENPTVRRQAAENAMAWSGGSLGALRRARREGETVFLATPQVRRSMFAQIGQLMKFDTPEAYATMATLAMTVYGAGSALNMLFGSGKPVEFDPRKTDWASVQLGGQWKTVNGERKYVGGYFATLLPQTSQVRALGKSVAAIERGDGASAIRAWEQFAYTSASPGLQLPPAAAGIGFTPEGRFTNNLGMGDRLRSLIPLPITGQAIARGQLRAPTSLGGVAVDLSQISGLNSYPGATAKEITGQQQAALRAQLADRTAEAVGARAFRSKGWQQEFARAGLPGASKQKTIAELRTGYVEYWAPVIARRDGVSIGIARARVADYFEGMPVVKSFREATQKARLDYWRANPRLLQQAVDLGIEQLSADEEKILVPLQRGGPR